MAGVKVKTCGISSPEDARACWELGADYLGLIFAASPRQVSIETATRIRAAVPDAPLVGVFVDAGEKMIETVAREAKLDFLQLHGAESTDFRIAIKQATGLPIIRVVHCQTENSAESAEDCVETDPETKHEIGDLDDFLLFDLVKGSANIGNGLVKLWRAAAKVSARQQIFLAGNLSTNNIRDALDQVNPFAVDVCRGVESGPGIKDLAATEQFISEVKVWQPKVK